MFAPLPLLWNFSPIAVFLLVISVLLFAIGIHAARRHRVPGATPAAITLFSMAIWMISYALEIAAVPLNVKLFWVNLEFISIEIVPLAWLVLVMEYTGWSQHLSRRQLLWLSIIPITTLLITWTNPVHGLMWSSAAINTGPDAIPALIFTRGPWFWIASAYAYILVAVSTFLLIGGLETARGIYRWQISLLLAVTILPWSGNLLYLTGTGIAQNLDLTALGLAASVPLLTWGVLGFRLLDIIPTARAEILETMPDAILVIDNEHRVVDVNRAGLAWFGLNRVTDVLSHPVAEASTLPEVLRQHLASAPPTPAADVSFEVDGERRHFSLRVSPLTDSRNEVVGWTAALRDITARWRAERAFEQEQALLRESEERYRLLAENASDIISLHDRDGTYLYVSPSCEKMMGFRPDEMVGRSPFAFIHPDDREDGARSLNIFMRTGRSIGAELRAVCKDGSTLWIEVKGRFVHDAATGDVQAMVMVTRDVDARHRMTQELRESELRYHSLFDATYEGILLSDNGVVTDVNQAALTLTGYARDEILGKPDLFFLTEGSREIALRNRELNTTEPFEVLGLRKDGSIFPVELRAIPVEHRGRTLIVTGFWDLTERKRAQEAEREQWMLSEALRDTATILSSTLEFEDLLDSILDNVGRIVPHDTTSFMLVERDIARVVRARGLHGDETASWAAGYQLAVEKTPHFRHMIETGRAVIIPDVTTNAGWQPNEDAAWIRGYMGVPVIINEKVIGILNVESARPDFFNKSHAQSLEALADQAGAAIHNANLYGVIRERSNRLAMLNQITRIGSATLDLAELVQELAVAAPALIGGDTCYITLWDEEHQRVMPAAASGPNQDTFLSLPPSSTSASMTKMAIKAKQPLIVENAGDNPSVPKSLFDVFNEQAALVLPLQANEKNLGAMTIAFSEPHHFKDEEISWGMQAAELISLAIAKAQSHAQLQMRNRELDAFSHLVAHDLKSPAGVVISYLDMISEVFADELPEAARPMLADAELAARKVTQIVDGLLMLTQLRSTEIQMEPVDMQVVTAFVLKQFEDDISRAGVMVDVEADLLPVMGIVVWVEEVLVNLVGNAIKYIGVNNDAPCIQIRAQHRDAVVRYEVTDNGAGISEEDQKNLFEMFTRFHHDQASGTGLGLSIVKRAVTRMNGTVGVESTPGEGSTFWFELPAVL